LLLSNRALNCGLGNEHDLVGRFYADHPRMTAGVLTLFDAPRYRPLYTMHTARRAGRSITVEGFLAIGDELSAQERLLRCGFHLPARWRSFPAFNSRAVNGLRQIVRGKRNGVRYRWPQYALQIARGMDAVALTSYRWLTNSPDDGRHGLLFVVHSEQAPNPDSRVQLVETRDRLDRRTVRVNWRLGELDLRTIRRGTALLAREVERAGIGTVAVQLDGKNVVLRDGFHHMGTTRMHTNPALGVVDQNARVHSTANLYIAGSAVFPTGGYANPTLTLVALAIRLADHLKTLFT
jgi:hypothetical protein